MSIKYKTIRIEKYCFDELDVCKEEYLKHHKEMEKAEKIREDDE